MASSRRRAWCGPRRSREVLTTAHWRRWRGRRTRGRTRPDIADVACSRRHLGAVHCHVATDERADVLDHIRLRDAIEGAVDHADVVDGALLEATKVEAVG